MCKVYVINYNIIRKRFWLQIVLVFKRKGGLIDSFANQIDWQPNNLSLVC
jgi:hypothetical protein